MFRTEKWIGISFLVYDALGNEKTTVNFNLGEDHPNLAEEKYIEKISWEGFSTCLTGRDGLLSDLEDACTLISSFGSDLFF